MIYLGRKLISIRTFHVYSPVWVGFGIRDLKIILLRSVKIGAGKVFVESVYS